MAELMTIGQFAAATWLSPKALRLYDRKGLLSPDTVDPHSGYRRYSPAQIDAARLITMLRRIDMPLDEIRTLMERSPEEQSALIAHFREHESEQHARRQSLARYLQHAVASGSLDVDGQPGVSTSGVTTRVVPRTPFLSATRHTAARDLPGVIRDNATRLSSLAEDRGGASGRVIVIYHGQVGWESDGPVEVCVPIEDADRAHRVEEEHVELFTGVPTADVQFPRILTAFEAVHRRAVELGLAPAGPPREVYEPAPPGRMPRCEVALPVREMTR